MTPEELLLVLDLVSLEEDWPPDHPGQDLLRKWSATEEGQRWSATKVGRVALAKLHDSQRSEPMPFPHAAVETSDPATVPIPPSDTGPLAGHRVGMSMAEILAAPRSVPDYLIEDIWRAGEPATLVGDRGVGKSTLALQLAAALAAGHTDFLGFSTGTPRTVLILSGEQSPESLGAKYERGSLPTDPEVPKRIHIAYGSQTGLAVESRQIQHDEPHPIDKGDRWSEQSKHARFENEATLRQLVEATRPDVIIIDPWASFFRGNESDNTDVSIALSFLQQFAREHGFAPLIVQHKGKSKAGSPEDQARGASRLNDWAECRITLTGPPPRLRDRSRHLTVNVLLNNDPAVDDFSIAPSADTGLFHRCEGQGQATDDVQIERLVQVLRDHGPVPGQEALGRLIRLSGKTAHNLAERARSAGRIDISAGKPRIYSAIYDEWETAD